jgi:hypothetical protein
MVGTIEPVTFSVNHTPSGGRACLCILAIKVANLAIFLYLSYVSFDHFPPFYLFLVFIFDAPTQVVPAVPLNQPRDHTGESSLVSPY